MTQDNIKYKKAYIRGFIFFLGSIIMAFFGVEMLIYADEIILKLMGFVFICPLPIWVINIIQCGFGITGPCPICKSIIKTNNGVETNIFCKSCNSYLDATGQALVEIDPNRIADLPTFATLAPWPDLTALSPTVPLSKDDFIMDNILVPKEGVRILDARWPDFCCVCGEKPTRELAIKRTVIYFPGKNVKFRQKEVMVAANGIPHCDEHSDGVVFGQPPGFNQICLLFRSYSYRNKYTKINT